MQEGNAIEVHNVTKSFKIYQDKGHTLKEKILFQGRRAYENRNVLNGITFSVKTGEAVGLIGHNGCGKSTILKLLTRIIYPNTGRIEMNGRVSSLIELGAGFHPDMSGRDNIYINASIFGLTRKEIDARLQEMITFSELEDYIDNPVRTYSSGMYMRLAFSVAINVDADILLIDEILGVGDANFQAKCFHKLREIKAKGTTIVIVSHSLGQIEQICERSIWIHEGGIRKEGAPRIVHPVYLDYMGQKKEKRNQADQRRKDEEAASKKSVYSDKGNELAGDHSSEIEMQYAVQQNENLGEATGQERQADLGNRAVVITNARLLNRNQKETSVFPMGGTMLIEIKYHRNDHEIKETVVGFHIYRNDGLDYAGSNTYLDRLPMGKINEDGVIRIELSNLWFTPAKYQIDLGFSDGITTTYLYATNRLDFEVVSGRDTVGLGEVEHKYYYDGILLEERPDPAR